MSATIREDARRSAGRLGHRLAEWLELPFPAGLLLARCVDCDDAATIAVGRFARPSMGGPAVQLRCRRRR